MSTAALAAPASARPATAAESKSATATAATHAEAKSEPAGCAGSSARGLGCYSAAATAAPGAVEGRKSSRASAPSEKKLASQQVRARQAPALAIVTALTLAPTLAPALALSQPQP
jgi:hypothetical protein